MSPTIMQRIEELSGERERIRSREGTHHDTPEDHRRLQQIEHELQVLWDLRRRELAGERIELDDDYLDRYDRY